MGEGVGLGQQHRMGRKRYTSQKSQRGSEDNRDHGMKELQLSQGTKICRLGKEHSKGPMGSK